MKTKADIDTQAQENTRNDYRNGKKGEISLSPAEKEAGIFPLMEKISKETLLFIGSQSGFLFIGKKEEFFRLRDYVEDGLQLYWLKSKAKGDSREIFSSIGDRAIISVYRRLSEEGIIIILEGKEQGAYWTRNEFLADYGSLLEDIGMKEKLAQKRNMGAVW